MGAALNRRLGLLHILVTYLCSFGNPWTLLNKKGLRRSAATKAHIRQPQLTIQGDERHHVSQAVHDQSLVWLHPVINP